jgi:hypothetical protein
LLSFCVVCCWVSSHPLGKFPGTLPPRLIPFAVCFTLLAVFFSPCLCLLMGPSRDGLSRSVYLFSLWCFFEWLVSFLCILVCFSYHLSWVPSRNFLSLEIFLPSTIFWGLEFFH